MTLAPPRAMDPRKPGGAGSKVIGDNLRALFGTGLLHNIFLRRKTFFEAVFSMCASTGKIYAFSTFIAIYSR